MGEKWTRETYSVYSAVVAMVCQIYQYEGDLDKCRQAPGNCISMEDGTLTTSIYNLQPGQGKRSLGMDCSFRFPCKPSSHIY